MFTNLLLGVLTSVVAWLLVAKGLRPKVAIRSHVVRSDTRDGPRYRFAIRNCRRLRSCTDIHIVARFSVFGCDPSDPVWTMVDLPIDDTQVHYLSPSWTYRQLRRHGQHFYPQSPLLFTEQLGGLSSLLRLGIRVDDENLPLEQLMSSGDRTVLTPHHSRR